MAPAREIHRRVRTGDERKPQCRHCEIGRRECRYDAADNSTRQADGFGINGAFQFSSDHVWLDTPSEVTFIHAVDVGNNEDESRASSAPTPLQVISAESNTSLNPMIDEPSPNVLMTDTPVRDDSMQILTPGPARDAVNFASPHSTTSGVSMETIDPVKSLINRRISGSTIYTRGPIEPLTDPVTARLLQHYMNHLACWLDLNDPQRQFTTFVPYLALSCPILLHAILAFSACHLSRLDGSYDESSASHYHDLCVQGLIPALADPSTALDNVLPISTVILRMYEMMSYETDHQRHLRGCSSLFTHNRRNIGFRALKRTAFWTYFREEIMVALATGKPSTINPSIWKADITWGGDTDYVKTEKMTMLVAEVVDYCFAGDREDQSSAVSQWDELQREVDAWKEILPESFQPLYVIEDSKPFPQISYLCTWHIIAMQFYHLVKVLLALHNPHRMTGIEFLHFARSIEVEILKHTIQLCGMTHALGDKHPGALVNAIQPLVICGRCLKKPEEQAELVRMLQRIEEVTTLTTSQGIQSLREAWDLHSDL
ncbi:Fc.00g074220.m01.CDS01 [Cosmosporella sp. VM-42]